jgi:hypothetical protein
MNSKTTFVLILAVLLAACGGGTDGVVISDAWGRAAPSSVQNGAFYMTIRNDGGEADLLLSAQAGACGALEIHESFMQDGGVMSMRPASREILTIPPGEEIALEVGGLHIMCLAKQQDFNPGDTIPLTLQFEHQGAVPVEVEIREQ